MDAAQRKMDGARRKLDDVGRRVERELGRAERQIDDAERRMEREAGPVWARPEPGARRARFTREQIAEAALKIADTEGFDAVSMRRVAAELGAGTMTLYHYVRTKDELLALMDNAIMGELLVPDGELPDDWRAALTLIAIRTRDAFERHPWAFEAMGDAQLGPNGLRHMEQSVGALEGLDLDDVERFELISLVDEYVTGYALRNRELGRDDSGAREAWLDQASDYIDEQVATGDYPHLSALLREEGTAAFWRRLESSGFEENRFERGLKRLLDGIELDLTRGGG
jgi:AcrR family transcriptional regulator